MGRLSGLALRLHPLRSAAAWPFLLALAFRWGKISPNRLFSAKISTHIDWRPRVRDRQQSKGKYSFLALFLKPSSILKSLYLKLIPWRHRDSPLFGWEAGEGTIHATAAGNGGAQLILTLPNPCPGFPRKQCREVGPPQPLRRRAKPPQRLVKGAGRFAQGPAQPQKRDSAS